MEFRPTTKFEKNFYFLYKSIVHTVMDFRAKNSFTSEIDPLKYKIEKSFGFQDFKEDTIRQNKEEIIISSSDGKNSIKKKIKLLNEAKPSIHIETLHKESSIKSRIVQIYDPMLYNYDNPDENGIDLNLVKLLNILWVELYDASSFLRNMETKTQKQ